jgi:hypothetical protein
MIRAIDQTLALFHDAYRELNSKRMFWISLVISGLVVLAFLAIGVANDGNLSLFGMRLPLPLPFGKVELYKIAFSNLGVGLWLTFVGAILAVVSTAGIFPDLITSGSVDLYLSKPISRPRLFLTKYATGLLFVSLQVAVFCAASFLVIGIRGGLWEPRLFLAIPLVVCFFSYLYCFSVLIGLLTRSTIAAVLLTMLFWFLLWGIDRAEIILLLGRTSGDYQSHTMDLRIKQQRGSLKAFEERLAATQPTTNQSTDLEQRRHDLEKLVDEQTQSKSTSHNVDIAHKVLYQVKGLLPKTRETNELLDRNLLDPDELSQYDSNRRPGSMGPRKPRPPRPPENGQTPAWADPEVIKEAQDEMRHRPLSWIIGTSLLFESVIVGFAAWIFCRRDY